MLVMLSAGAWADAISGSIFEDDGVSVGVPPVVDLLVVLVLYGAWEEALLVIWGLGDVWVVFDSVVGHSILYL